MIDPNETAKRVADGLLADLRSGKLAKIDIDTIRKRLLADGEAPPDGDAYEMLEMLTVRRVVEAVR